MDALQCCTMLLRLLKLSEYNSQGQSQVQGQVQIQIQGYVEGQV